MKIEISGGTKCDLRDLVYRLSTRYSIKIDDFLSILVCKRTKDPFKVLIATLLTQNSTDKAALKAYEDLEREIGVLPDKLAVASVDDIAKAIRPAGLYNTKARNIKEISNIIHGVYKDSLDPILNQPPNEARKLLLMFPGIGVKTADVVLLTCKGYRTFPVDTHIFRISKRLGIKGRSYSEVSNTWVESVDDPLKSHLLLITHGRKTCKAVKPKCQECVLIDCCQYYSGLLGSTGHSTSRGRNTK